ncbi:hypothetical protein I4F81_005464 [Pyropia yezoensis]|uniref:Uncharacterized protein n=1 Tax=Pyropia yezoensis TaxID=2788 RepID=A0ACC3BYC1_PYRYE|nr:hypothetical protein I4F81_005464 [Neopyropia yezoensis]
MSVAALFSALSPDERRFMLAPPGAVEPGLSPAALAAAAVWTTRETGSVATLEALCPGGAFIPSPGDLPGEACNIDMSHLLVPFSKHDGRIIGHASSVTRLFCTPGSRTTGSSWQPPVIDGGGALLPADSGPGALAMNGRFMYDEDARHLLLRTTIGGNPAWFGYAFAIRLDAGTSGEGADSAAEGTSGASSWEEARAEAATRGKCATDAIVEVARSGMDFSNFATSLSANVNGVYRHCMPPSWPGDLSTYFGSEGVVPAMAVLPLFGAYGGNAAVVGSADWGVAGGGVARLDALQTALSSLTLTTTPLVRDAERLLLLPQPADDRGGIDDGKGNDDDGSQLSVPSAEAVKEFTSLF